MGIRIPAFVESKTDRGLLQLEFISLGSAQKWMETKEDERNHIPSKSEMMTAIDTITEFLSRPNNELIAGGVELSRGTVPLRYQRWIECKLMQSLDANLPNHQKNFFRYQHFLSDEEGHHQKDDHARALKRIPSC